MISSDRLAFDIAAIRQFLHNTGIGDHALPPHIIRLLHFSLNNGLAILRAHMFTSLWRLSTYHFAIVMNLWDNAVSMYWLQFNYLGLHQVVAYLLISAASTAVPMTNKMRDNVDNLFTDCLAASISMAFFGFLTLALSALISGYKLSTQSYI